jgi:hypothetical protein
MTMVSLIVMEPGSDWPGRIGDSENVIELGDSDDAMLQRVRWRLASLRLRGARLRVAVIACNGATDAASVAGRERLARELLAAVADSSYGRVMLSASELASTQLRLELLSLAEALSYAGRGRATVLVKFTEPSRVRRLPSLRSDSRFA